MVKFFLLLTKTEWVGKRLSEWSFGTKQHLKSPWHRESHSISVEGKMESKLQRNKLPQWITILSISTGDVMNGGKQLIVGLSLRQRPHPQLHFLLFSFNSSFHLLKWGNQRFQLERHRQRNRDRKRQSSTPFHVFIFHIISLLSLNKVFCL